MADDLAAAIMATAQQLRVDPLDLATAISYETGGTFDPWQRGPTTKWGQHRGLIQWGEPQREQYGVYKGMPNSDQLQSVGKYLTDAGVEPGMGLLDIYSAINVGKVKRYNASDANNGGAWGTVRDKVEHQMDGHRTKAQKLLAPSMQSEMPTPPVDPAVATQASPVGDMLSGLMSGFQGMGAQPTGPRVLQDDSAQTIAAAQGLKDRGSQLKSAFRPDVLNLTSLGKRPAVV